MVSQARGLRAYMPHARHGHVHGLAGTGPSLTVSATAEMQGSTASQTQNPRAPPYSHSTRPLPMW